MTHGGITGGVTLITEDGGKKNTWGNDLPFFHDSFRSPADTFSPPSYFPLVLLISIFLPVIVASPGNLALRTCESVKLGLGSAGFQIKVEYFL